MNTEENQDIQTTLDLTTTNTSMDVQEATATNVRKPKWLWLGIFAILIGGTVTWRSLSSSQESTIEVTDNIEQARLTVKAVTF